MKFDFVAAEQCLKELTNYRGAKPVLPETRKELTTGKNPPIVRIDMGENKKVPQLSREAYQHTTEVAKTSKNAATRAAANGLLTVAEAIRKANSQKRDIAAAKKTVASAKTRKSSKDR